MAPDPKNLAEKHEHEHKATTLPPLAIDTPLHTETGKSQPWKSYFPSLASKTGPVVWADGSDNKGILRMQVEADGSNLGG